MGIKEIFKRLFGKKDPIYNDRKFKLIVKLIKDGYDISEQYAYLVKGDYVYYIEPIHDMVFYYNVHDKSLEYDVQFVHEIYKYIPDGRLLQPDGEFFSKVYKKLYGKEVLSVRQFK